MSVKPPPFSFGVQNAEWYDHALPSVARAGPVADWVRAGQVKRKAASHVLLFGKCADGRDVTVLFAQPVHLYLAVPPHLNDVQVARLCKIHPHIQSARKVHRSDLRGYRPPAPDAPQDKIATSAFARLEFASHAHADSFFFDCGNYSEPGTRCEPSWRWDWSKVLEQVDLPEPSPSCPDHYAVHHVEAPLEALLNAANERVGIYFSEDDGASATMHCWLTLEDFVPDANTAERMVTHANLHGFATADQISKVDTETVVPKFSTLSFDFEVTSARRQFPELGNSQDPIICCAVSTTQDHGATVHEEVLCVGAVAPPSTEELRADATRPPPLITVLDTEQELCVELAKRVCNRAQCVGQFSMFVGGYNTTGFDNVWWYGRSFLFWLCHRQEYGWVRTRAMEAARRMRRYGQLMALNEKNEITYSQLKQAGRALFDIEKGEKFNPLEPPLVDRLLGRAYANNDLPQTDADDVAGRFTRADYDYFASGPDTDLVFRCGLVPTVPLHLHTKKFSAGAGKNMTSDFFNNGVVVLDMWKYFKDTERLDDYSLKATSKHFLHDVGDDANEKIEMGYTDMMDAWASADLVKRREVALYCARDATLPIRLAKKKTAWADLREFSKLHRIPFRDMIFSGQQRLMWWMFRKHMYLNQTIDNARPALAKQGKFKGATVQTALTGYYEKPVLTLDFKSLYPAIICQHNLDFSTMLGPDDAVPPGATFDTHRVDGHDPTDPVVMQRVITSHHGLLPKVLDSLLESRKRVKEQMKVAKKAKESDKYALLNSKQLALKISANSMYGAAGAPAGAIRDERISATTTAIGRKLIQMTKEFCEERGFKVIYGDTDSVFILAKSDSIDEAFKSGDRLCEAINNELFGDLPKIEIEIDYIFRNLLLVGKKCYAGLKVDYPGHTGTLMCKGLSVVRRNYNKWQRNGTEAIFEQMMPVDPTLSCSVEAGRPRMIAELKKQLNKVIDNKLTPHDFSITQAVKDASEYEGKHAGCELATRINRRILAGRMKAVSLLRRGDRMRMVRVAKAEDGSKLKTMYKMTESPDYMVQHPELGLEIDRLYYIGKLEDSLINLMQFHEPDVGKYFDRARTIIRAQTAEAKARALLAKQFGTVTTKRRPPREGRWAHLLPSRALVRRAARVRKQAIKENAKKPVKRGAGMLRFLVCKKDRKEA